MVLFNYSTKELTAKVVYYGPGLCGKTTNLQWVHEKLPIKNKGKMLSLATETDRTLFFDFLPIELGTIRGMRTRIQLYTVPGQVFYNATRRMVLKGADCVVFVADSQEAMLDANVESMENLRQNLEANEIDPDEVPMVLQYNKRDLPNALPLEILNDKLNPRGVPFYEAVALKGTGVEETLKGVTTLVFRSLANKYGGAAEVAAHTPAPAPPPPPRTLSGSVTATPAARTSSAATPAAAPPPMAAAPEAPEPAPAPLAAAGASPAAAAWSPAPSAPLRPGQDTVPPVPLEADDDYDEDLLDSLQLSPTGEDAEVVDEPEALPLEEAELEMVDEEPAPPRPTRPGVDTVVSTPDEVDDLRRRIARRVPELDLDRMEEEEQEVEEISLETSTSGASGGPTFRPYLEEDLALEVPSSAAEDLDLEPPAAPEDIAYEPPPTPVVEEWPAPVAASAAQPQPAAMATVSTPVPPAVPVSVDLVAGPGQADVAIPVEIVLNNGTAQVNLHVRLTLNLKLQPPQ